jgi:serine/threonine-protein kinase
MDEPAMTRLFSVMDTKPLSKLVSAWKAKYPNDSQRLLKALDGMGRVLPKDQIALNEPPSGSNDSTGAPDSTAPVPAQTPDSPAPAADSNPTATPQTDPNSATPTPTSPPSLAPPADAPAPADSNSTTASPTPPPDSTQNPVSTATTN